MTVSNFTCKNAWIINKLQNTLDGLKKETKYNPSTKTDIIMLNKALTQYKLDCVNCKNDSECLDIADIKLIRQFPFIRDSIYPWKNYDWSYSNFVNNNYSAKATGSSKRGSKIGNNIDIFFNLFDAYFKSPNPSNSSVAGVKSKTSDYPVYGCNGDRAICSNRHKIKYGQKQTMPYDNDFFKKNLLSGEYSSSYFQKVGFCDRPDIKNRYKCDKNKFVWINDPADEGQIPTGNCYQPKYVYIDNTPGLSTQPTLDAPFPVGKKVIITHPKLKGLSGTIVKKFVYYVKNTYKVKCDKDDSIRVLKPENMVNLQTEESPTEDKPFIKGTRIKIKNMPGLYGLNDTLGTIMLYYNKSSDNKYTIRVHKYKHRPPVKLSPSFIKTEGLKGLIPSMINETLSFTPDKIFKAFMGQDVPGHMEVQKCLTPDELNRKSHRFFRNKKRKKVLESFSSNIINVNVFGTLLFIIVLHKIIVK